MPDTPTARIALYKSKADGSEDVNYSTDLGGNWDKVDVAVGFLAVTSSTHPSSPWNGQAIRETDTGKLLVWSGAAWQEIVTSSAAVAGLLTTAGGILMRGSSSTANVAAAVVTGDTSNRFAIRTDGQLQWGTGSAAADTNLYRSAANVLKTDDSLIVTGTVSAQVESASGGYTPASGFTVSSYMARRTCGVTVIYVSLTYTGSTITANSGGNITDTLCLTTPSGWRPPFPAVGAWDKAGIACGAWTWGTDGTVLLKTLDPTATLSNTDSVNFTLIAV